MYNLKYNKESFSALREMLGEIEYKAIIAILEEDLSPEIHVGLFPVMERDLYIFLCLRTFSKLFDPIPNQITLRTSLENYSETLWKNTCYVYINYDISIAKNFFSYSLGNTIIYDVELDYFAVNSLQQHEIWREKNLSLPSYLRELKK